MKQNLVLVLMYLLLAISCYAQSSAISSGATWLSSNQNSDGSWGAQADLSSVYSAEAIDALKSSGTGITDYNEGVTWISSQDVTSTDELSRKIVSLVNGGIDSSSLVNMLISYKNSDGGWSYKDSPASGPADTALALSDKNDNCLADDSLTHVGIVKTAPDQFGTLLFIHASSSGVKSDQLMNATSEYKNNSNFNAYLRNNPPAPCTNSVDRLAGQLFSGFGTIRDAECTDASHK